MDKEKEIIILSVTKTREGKSILEFVNPVVGETEYRVGHLIRQDWREPNEQSWFELKDQVGHKAIVEVGYNTSANGRIYEKILDVIEIKEKVI